MTDMNETPEVGGAKVLKMRGFVIREEDGTEHSTFTGYLPRQAALKAASRFGGTKEAPATLKLRERGARKLHVFKAWKEMIDAPEQRPAWLPAKISRAFVEKIKIEHLGKKVSAKAVKEDNKKVSKKSTKKSSKKSVKAE